MYAKRQIGFDWGSLVSTALNAATSYGASVQQTKQAQAAANISFYNAQAAAAQAQSNAAKSQDNMKLYLIVGGVAVVGLVAFLALRKRR
jgi:cobalamin biosynthesis Mg chelatase CobN